MSPILPHRTRGRKPRESPRESRRPALIGDIDGLPAAAISVGSRDALRDQVRALLPLLA
jgi:acetyl esterase/lipase